MPPLLDYPNHLARLWVLASGSPSPFYAPRWRIMPDLGIDIPGVWLLRHVPVHAGGRLIIAAALLISFLGPLAYGRVMLRHSWWPLATALVVYNETFLLGFLNFTLSVGLAFVVAAVWLRWREDNPPLAIAVCAIAAVGLFFCHLMGLLCLPLLIAGHEVAALYRQPRRIVARGLAVLVLFAVPGLLYLCTELHDVVGEPEYLPPLPKLAQLMAPFINYDPWLDSIAIVATLAVLGVSLALRRALLPVRGAAIIGLTLALYAAAPFAFKGTYNLDTRFAIVLGFLLFTCVAPSGFSPRTTRVIAVGMALLFVARMAVVLTTWSAHNQDLADLRAAMEPVPAGASVFVVRAEGPLPEYAGRLLSNGLRTDAHMPALVLIERQAWWPFLFDNPSQQPIETREPYRRLAIRVGGMPLLRDLPAQDLSGFDYVLVFSADTQPDLSAEPRVTLVRRSGYAALFRVALPH